MKFSYKTQAAIKDMVSFSVFVGIPVTVMIAAVFAAVQIGYHMIDKPACEKVGQLYSEQHFWSVGTGCLIKHEGRWVKDSVLTGSKVEVTIKDQTK